MKSVTYFTLVSNSGGQHIRRPDLLRIEHQGCRQDRTCADAVHGGVLADRTDDAPGAHLPGLAGIPEVRA